MLFLSTPQADIPMEKDPIALAIVVGLLVIFTIYTLCKKAKAKKQAAIAAAQAEEAAAKAAQPQVAPGAAGQLKLHNVEPKTAAMLMAIVADKLQKPVNELRFISIKEVN